MNATGIAKPRASCPYQDGSFDGRINSKQDIVEAMMTTTTTPDESVSTMAMSTAAAAATFAVSERKRSGFHEGVETSEGKGSGSAASLAATRSSVLDRILGPLLFVCDDDDEEDDDDEDDDGDKKMAAADVSSGRRCERCCDDGGRRRRRNRRAGGRRGVAAAPRTIGRRSMCRRLVEFYLQELDWMEARQGRLDVLSINGCDGEVAVARGIFLLEHQILSLGVRQRHKPRKQLQQEKPLQQSKQQNVVFNGNNNNNNNNKSSNKVIKTKPVRGSLRGNGHKSKAHGGSPSASGWVLGRYCNSRGGGGIGGGGSISNSSIGVRAKAAVSTALSTFVDKTAAFRNGASGGIFGIKQKGGVCHISIRGSSSPSTYYYHQPKRLKQGEHHCAAVPVRSSHAKRPHIADRGDSKLKQPPALLPPTSPEACRREREDWEIAIDEATRRRDVVAILSHMHPDVHPGHFHDCEVQCRAAAALRSLVFPAPEGHDDDDDENRRRRRRDDDNYMAPEHDGDDDGRDNGHHLEALLLAERAKDMVVNAGGIHVLCSVMKRHAEGGASRPSSRCPSCPRADAGLDDEDDEMVRHRSHLLRSVCAVLVNLPFVREIAPKRRQRRGPSPRREHAEAGPDPRLPRRHPNRDAMDTDDDDDGCDRFEGDEEDCYEGSYYYDRNGARRQFPDGFLSKAGMAWGWQRQSRRQAYQRGGYRDDDGGGEERRLRRKHQRETNCNYDGSKAAFEDGDAVVLENVDYNVAELLLRSDALGCVWECASNNGYGIRCDLPNDEMGNFERQLALHNVPIVCKKLAALSLDRSRRGRQRRLGQLQRRQQGPLPPHGDRPGPRRHLERQPLQDDEDDDEEQQRPHVADIDDNGNNGDGDVSSFGVARGQKNRRDENLVETVRGLLFLRSCVASLIGDESVAPTTLGSIVRGTGRNNGGRQRRF